MLMRLTRLELTKLLPWLYVLAAFDLIDVVWAFFASAPNQAVWAKFLPLYASQMSAGMVTTLAALLLAYSGFPRDSDDGTLAFVFSLPVPRSQIFLSKLLAPGLVLSGHVLWLELLRWGQQLSNPTSFGGETFRADWAGWVIGLSLLLVWVSVAYCQLLTVFRRFGLMLVVTLFFVVQSLESRLPWLRNLAPASMLRVEFAGQRVLVQWTTVGAHILGAIVAGSLAACVWVGPMDRITATLTRWARRPWLAWSAGSLCALAAIIVAKRATSQPQTSSAAPAATAATAGAGLEAVPLTRRTQHYELSYPEKLAPRIEVLAVAADGIYERLAERLGVVPSEQIVVVDFMHRAAVHAGSANLNTIRMDPSLRPSAEGLERTFAHETTHVISFLASDRRLTSEMEAAGFFCEGLATALAHEVRPSAESVAALQLEAALAHQRLHPTFAQLIRYQDFTLRHGPLLVYPLGFSWTRALIDSCGPEAPGRVLRALGSPDAPLTLGPEALWQHLLQRAGCDIVSVNTTWENQLAVSAAELKPELDRVPELVGGTPRRVGDELQLHAELVGTPLDGGQYFLQVRTKTTGPEQDGTAIGATLGPSGELEFHLPAQMEVDGTLQFHLGLIYERQGFPVRFDYAWTKSLVAH